MTPETITAILSPLSVIILAYITYLTNRQVKATHAVAVQIDTAVNGKAPGEASISQQVESSAAAITTILDKQERDVPTPSTEDVDNGNGASIRKQLTHLTELVETLGKVVDPPQAVPSTKSKRGEP